MRNCFDMVLGDSAVCFVLKRSGSSFGSESMQDLKNEDAQHHSCFHREHMTSK